MNADDIRRALVPELIALLHAGQLDRETVAEELLRRAERKHGNADAREAAEHSAPMADDTHLDA